ncbi:unnamed protein product [Closterium sp. NIES-53]
MGSLPDVVCEFCDRWFPNSQVYGGHKSRRTPCQGLSAVARTSQSTPSAGLHALLFVQDTLSDAPAALASPTASNASNTINVSGPPRVPEADEDETPSAGNEGAPEDEHQPPPRTPAADTREHPESQLEGSQASPPTSISGQSDATPLNPLALKLLHFVQRVNGGMGMAEVDINGLLHLVVEPGLAPLVTSELRNCKDLERFEMERLAGLNRGWSLATFEIDGHPPQRLLFQNSAQDRLSFLGPTTYCPPSRPLARCAPLGPSRPPQPRSLGPDSPQQNGIAERRIGFVMEVARTSMIHAAAPHFLWPFAVRYAAHQLNLWPHVSLPETSPTLCWAEEVGDASVFRVWGSRAFVRDTSADKLSPHAIPCVFLGFVPDGPGWQFYHPTSRCVFPSHDVMFDESVPFYRLLPYRSAPPPPPPLFLAPGPPLVAVGSGDARGAASGGVASGGEEPGGAESEGANVVATLRFAFGLLSVCVHACVHGMV